MGFGGAAGSAAGRTSRGVIGEATPKRWERQLRWLPIFEGRGSLATGGQSSGRSCQEEADPNPPVRVEEGLWWPEIGRAAAATSKEKP